MNINKILNDTMSSVKSTYNTAEKAITSPKKVEIVVIHKLDLPGTYGDLFQAVKGLKTETIYEVWDILKKHQTTIKKIIENESK